MRICEKCKQEVRKSYDCEHTNDKEYCVECYTELHYYLSENTKKDKNPI